MHKRYMRLVSGHTPNPEICSLSGRIWLKAVSNTLQRLTKLIGITFEREQKPVCLFASKEKPRSYSLGTGTTLTLFQRNKQDHEFVEPRVSLIKQTHSELEDSPKEKLTSAIGPDVRRYYVLGPQDCGLTTAAFMVCRHIAVQFNRFEAVPVYVNLNEVSANKASF